MYLCQFYFEKPIEQFSWPAVPWLSIWGDGRSQKEVASPMAAGPPGTLSPCGSGRSRTERTSRPVAAAVAPEGSGDSGSVCVCRGGRFCARICLWLQWHLKERHFWQKGAAVLVNSSRDRHLCPRQPWRQQMSPKGAASLGKKHGL